MIDSLTLPKVLDLVVAAGADYKITEMEIGRTNVDPSKLKIEVSSDDIGTLANLCDLLHAQGANRIGDQDALLEQVVSDGVLPRAFYSTTNLETEVRVMGTWVRLKYPEMDCAIRVTFPGTGGIPEGADPKVEALPMHKARTGDWVVTGDSGVRVATPERDRRSSAFEFMASDASSEKPKSLIISRVAQRVREATPEGKVLAVCGPAVIHTGAGPYVAKLIRDGWVHALFAGNGFATHDIESNVLGTSLGVSLSGTEDSAVLGGHSNHLRVINVIRRHGSIARAVEAGYVRSGVMFECVQAGIPFVLGGSVRDDGPLPDVYTDTVKAQDAMREIVPEVKVALMLASTLHAIATGNMLAANVETFCVDINQAVVTKLADRGSHQALGIVTDVGLFAAELLSFLDDPAKSSTSPTSTPVAKGA